MSKISTEELMDYLDGQLDGARGAAVEAYLRENAEEAQLIAEMKLASQALQDWDSTLPVQASENFWPQLRDKLPAQPGNSWMRRLGMKPQSTVKHHGWAMPTLRLSIGAAVMAALIAMAVFMSAPQQSVTPAQADLTPEEEAFITQSLQRHEAYSVTQPGSIGVTVSPGDRQSSENGEDDDEEYVP